MSKGSAVQPSRGWTPVNVAISWCDQYGLRTLTPAPGFSVYFHLDSCPLSEGIDDELMSHSAFWPLADGE